MRDIAQPALFHRSGDLLGDGALDRGGSHFFSQIVLIKPALERRADMQALITHDVISFSRRRASSNSSTGVACDFLMKAERAINIPS